jgi:hypothetical protein
LLLEFNGQIYSGSSVFILQDSFQFRHGSSQGSRTNCSGKPLKCVNQLFRFAMVTFSKNAA